MILAKAVAFGEALKPEFKEYQEKVIENIKEIERVFNENGIKMITGGTDNHLILLDLRDKEITGLWLQDKLAEIGIITNKNAVPFDTLNKNETSGLRLGTPAITARGVTKQECNLIAHIIVKVINKEIDEENMQAYKDSVSLICRNHPLN